MKYTREEFDESGGYDCMYGGVLIYVCDAKGGFLETVCRLDGQHYGQGSCNFSWDPAVMLAAADNIVSALNAWERIKESALTAYGNGGLLPCPFCGGVAEEYVGERNFTDVKIRCGGCGAETALYDAGEEPGFAGGTEDPDTLAHNRANALAAWNKRTL